MSNFGYGDNKQYIHILGVSPKLLPVLLVELNRFKEYFLTIT